MLHQYNLSIYFTAQEAAKAESILLETLKRNPAGATHAQLAYDLGRSDIHLGQSLGILLTEMQRIGSIKLVEDDMSVSDMAYGLVNDSLRVDVNAYANARLMAAAPDMLSALEDLTSWVDATQHTLAATNRRELAAQTASARRAINKARDKQLVGQD